MPFIRMKNGESLKFFGPMHIRIKNGEIEILCKRFGEGEELVIHKYKSYLVRALKDTELDINMSSESQIQSVEEDEPYNEWLEIADTILSSKPEKIVILGGIDSGKSTYTVLLANKTLIKNYKPAVIDGDVGQADIGPPGFVSMAYPDKQFIWLRELEPVTMKFIGDIKPQYYTDTIIYNLLLLSNKALEDNRKPVIIDTDGWIGDEYAVNYKYRLIEKIEPDILIVLGGEAHGLFTRYEKIGVNVYELKTPKIKRTRNREDRRILRRDKYREYLANTELRKISLKEILVYGHPLFYGKEVSLDEIDRGLSDKILYMTRIYNVLYIVTNTLISNDVIEMLKKKYGVNRIRFFNKGFEKNQYIALSNGVSEYPGLVEKIDFSNKEIYVWTKYRGIVKKIIFSNIKLLEDFSEQINYRS